METRREAGGDKPRPYVPGRPPLVGAVAALLSALACVATGAEVPGPVPAASAAVAAAAPSAPSVPPAAAPAGAGISALVPPSPSRFFIRPRVVFAEHLYEGAFLGPSAAFFEPKARELFLADTKNNLVGIFTAEGVPLFAFGSDELREPTKVAADGSGRVYVLDNDRTKVKVFSYRGQYLGPLDLPGAGPKPSFSAITVDADGNLYVGDNESCRVLVFGPDGKPRQRFGECGVETGQFQAITGIAVDKERIVVTDAQVVSVQVFDKHGNFVRGWGKHDMGIQNFSLPQAVAIDAQGRVIVIDTLRHEIKFFDGEGNFLDRFGGLGSGIGQVTFPTGVACDDTGWLFVVDKGNSRVQVLQIVEGVLESSAPTP